MKLATFLLVFLVFSLSSFAESLQLVNDSPYVLKATVRANDGSYLGEITINPGQTSTWTNNYGQMGSWGSDPNTIENAPRSRTPYSVIWYCPEGKEYSISTDQPTGGTTTAQSGDGSRVCSPKPYKDENGNEVESTFGKQPNTQEQVGPPSSGVGPPP